MAKFLVAKGFEDKEINLPKRQTRHAAGYDFEAAEDVVIYSYQTALQNLLATFASLLEDIEDFPEDLSKKIENVKQDDINSIETYQEVRDFLFNHKSLSDGQKNRIKVLIRDSKPILVKTGVKCQLAPNQYLELVNRSSLSLKKNLILANSVGIIDSDYFENEDNDGHIMFQFLNFGPDPVVIHKGDRIGQGILHEFKLMEDDDLIHGEKRGGGFGSTN